MMLQQVKHNDVDRKRKRDAERQRRRYARLKAGQGVASVTYPVAVVDLLIATQWLAVDKADDPREIGNAIERWLNDVARIYFLSASQRENG